MRVRLAPDGAGGTCLVREPWPEPVVPALYRDICAAPYDIPAEFQRARHGVPREEVWPLTIPPALLERWAAQLDTGE
jgi:hypothetical protein